MNWNDFEPDDQETFVTICPGWRRRISGIVLRNVAKLLETEDKTVYFDARKQGDIWWASPVQVYLELMAGDKRDQETAEQVKSYILRNLQTVQE